MESVREILRLISSLLTTVSVHVRRPGAFGNVVAIEARQFQHVLQNMLGNIRAQHDLSTLDVTMCFRNAITPPLETFVDRNASSSARTFTPCFVSLLAEYITDSLHSGTRSKQAEC